MESWFRIHMVFMPLLLLGLAGECPAAVGSETGISGRVLTESSPLKGAQVFVYQNYSDIKAGQHFRVSGPTADDGFYNASLPRGKYYFVARGSRDGKEFFAYHGNNPVKVGDDDSWITLLANPLKAPLSSGGSSGLKGIVTYKGQPIKDAYVTAYKAGSGVFKGLGFRTESVSRDGSFTFPLQPGNYVLVAKKISSGKGNRPPKEGDLYCYCPNNPVEVAPDRTTAVEIPCYPKDDRASFLAIPPIKGDSLKTVEHRVVNGKAGIKGKVTGSDGRPIAGILVLAYRTTKPVFLTYHLSHGTEYTAETSPDGSFFIPVDADGDYYLVARDTLGDGPHRGELFGLYNGNSRHVVAYRQGTLVDSVEITAGRVMDDGAIPEAPVTAATATEKTASGRSPLRIGDSVLAVDTAWEGDVVISGVIVVKKGVTLTLKPGTTVRFARVDRDRNSVGDGELRIEGRIVALGTAENRIVFTSAEKSKSVRDWSYIHLLASQADNVFEYCRFEYGFSGIQVHYSSVRIADCQFANNHEGLHFNTANVLAEHNTFTGNGSAIRFKRLEGKVVIRNNDIHGNEIGVLFGRQQINAVDFQNLNNPVDYPLFTGNSFHDNGKYNFSMGEGQNLDIEVKNNWWGTELTLKVGEGMFDQESDREVGKIVHQPFLRAPLPDAGVRGVGLK